MFIWGRERRCVSLAGSGISDYLDFLIEPAHAAAGAAEVMQHIARHRDGWDFCDFQELRSGSPLPAIPIAGLRVEVQPCGVCPVLRLAGSWDEMLAALPHKFLRRARNRVHNAGEARFELAGAGNFEELLCALLRLHQARWNAVDESGVMATPALQNFYRQAAGELLRAGMLRLYGLRSNGVLIAALYGFAGHGRFYAYLAGFDPAHARLSPGTVLMSHAIEQAIAEGLTEFDFLRKRESFKYLWGGQDEVNRRLLIAA